MGSMMILKVQARRLLGRPRLAPFIAVLFLLLCWSIYSREDYMPKSLGILSSAQPQQGRLGALQSPEAERLQQATGGKRKQFEDESRALDSVPGAGAIYGNTLRDLVGNDTNIGTYHDALQLVEGDVAFTDTRRFSLNPYPHNTPAWQFAHAEHVPCIGPAGRTLEHTTVFKGRPQNFPSPSFGSYDVLGLTDSLCFERETRMGQYGLAQISNKAGEKMDWDMVSWGELQSQCRDMNRARFSSDANPSKYLGVRVVEEQGMNDLDSEPTRNDESQMSTATGSFTNKTTKAKEPRTVVLLRSYTGKTYSENDKQVIRSLVTELSLQTGGEYEVVLFLHVRDDSDIWTSGESYRRVVEEHVPREFWNMTVLWNSEKVERMYTKLPPKALLVHNGQFLPVQIFMQEHREFDYVWNWEMDSRVIGHHYSILTKMADFARKQPRKGLWERNARYYIPSFHGDYETDFRKTVEEIHFGDSIWGAPDVPVVSPIGPKPPVPTPEEDDYEWGVGEEADLITLAPIFNPVGSNWILRNQVWGYSSEEFAGGNLPRRATIITQLRASRRLIDIMHAEDLAGNHVASEMVGQTVALLHGLKAVYAPMPVFFDRPWDGAQLARWFNGGPKGDSGGAGSAMGWGEEGRFQGSTWYFRAIPPQRLYNNWMGYEDTGIGGAAWEAEHGRTCLPMMILHPIKEVRETPSGYASDSKLPY